MCIHGQLQRSAGASVDDHVSVLLEEGRRGEVRDRPSLGVLHKEEQCSGSGTLE